MRREYIRKGQQLEGQGELLKEAAYGMGRRPNVELKAEVVSANSRLFQSKALCNASSSLWNISLLHGRDASRILKHYYELKECIALIYLQDPAKLVYEMA